VVLAAISSILLMLRAVSYPYISILGRIPGTNKYSDIQRHPGNETLPGIMIFRVESSILYFNTENIRKKIWTEIFGPGKSVNTVILDLESSPYVDLAGARFIKKLYLDLQSKGISLKLAETRARVRDMLRYEEVDTLIGPIARKVTVEDVVRESV
jgi:MFS superfamily sulfate permease-like transporter